MIFNDLYKDFKNQKRYNDKFQREVSKDISQIRERRLTTRKKHKQISKDNDKYFFNV